MQLRASVRSLQSRQRNMCVRVAVEKQQVAMEPSLVQGWGLLSHHDSAVAA